MGHKMLLMHIWEYPNWLEHPLCCRSLCLEVLPCFPPSLPSRNKPRADTLWA